MKCIGFTNQENVRDVYLNGTGVWAIVATKDSSVSDAMLSALVKIMRDSGLALICRYVYNAVSRPKMMALFPNDTLPNSPGHNSLLMHELIYKDNMIQMMLPTLQVKKTEPSVEQLAVIDQLIDAMDLMDVKINDTTDGEDNERGEAFKKLLNPALQHTYRRIAHRALHPKEPLIAPGDDLMAMLNIPQTIQAAIKPHVNKAKDLFKLEAIERDTVSRKYIAFNKIKSLTNDSQNAATVPIGSHENDETLVEVGTVTPAEDFDELLRRGEPVATVTGQIQRVIQSLVFQSVMLAEEKVLQALIMYRERAKMLATSRYNEWIVDFKKMLLQRRKMDVWEKIIVGEKMGLITNTESESSTITDEDAERFYRDAEQGAAEPIEQLANDDDDNDLFECL